MSQKSSHFQRLDIPGEHSRVLKGETALENMLYSVHLNNYCNSVPTLQHRRGCLGQSPPLTESQVLPQSTPRDESCPLTTVWKEGSEPAPSPLLQQGSLWATFEESTWLKNSTARSQLQF